MTLADYILVFGAYPASIIFLCVFAITNRAWWTDWLGWVIFSLALSIVLVFTISFLYHLLGSDYPGREIVKGAAYGLLTLAFLAKSVAVIYERSRGRQPVRMRRGD